MNNMTTFKSQSMEVCFNYSDAMARVKRYSSIPREYDLGEILNSNDKQYYHLDVACLGITRDTKFISVDC